MDDTGRRPCHLRLTFVVQWLAAQVPETSVTVEAGPILQAAAMAKSIW